MSEYTANNKRIAKNTMMLYIRMLLLMAVNLYTSRVVLSTLGVEDYGIYDVVGGVVAMFTVISGSISGTISRFITFELGKGDLNRLNTIFSTSMIIQFALAVLIILLIETVGLWFLTNKLVIPADRLFAAKWVLQFSLISLVINIISTPYNAAIIAHEKMSAFAYISIIEAVGKLLVVYMIAISPIDKLILYGLLLSVVSLIIRSIYSIYCRIKFEECKFRWVFDKPLLRDMFSFAGWSYIGYFSGLCRDQGGGILLNMLGGGPIVNAARGISTQVNVAITQFATNFMMALNPQITKSYASGNREYMMTLIFQGSRLSFYMLLMLSLPILLNTEYILMLWLKDVPEYTVQFVQLSLIFAMIESISYPLMTSMAATGKIRNYQIVVGGLQIMNLPISYVLLKAGLFPEIVFIVAIFISVCCLLARLIMLRPAIGVSIRRFFRAVLLNIVKVSACSIIILYLISYSIQDINLWSFIIICIISILCTVMIIYLVGCTQSERSFINTRVRQYLVNFRDDRNQG